ncbi:MAG TPA: DNRLRE domain-containing protein [Anaerolineae bacterium]|nr:DNRLRE domain-containing protein [Anaerolineae bacterium]
MAVLGVLILILATAVLSTSAQSGTQITSAVVSVYQSNGTSGPIVYAYPISKTWSEDNVTWNSFANSYWLTPLGSFVASGGGWRSIAITAQVQQWVNNSSQNFGIALVQETVNAVDVSYISSEHDDASLRPKLDVCYIRGSGPQTCITIQRTGAAQGNVADADLWEGNPDDPFGGSANPIFTGDYTNPPLSGVKIAVLRFNLVTPTAVALQSLDVRAVPAQGIGLLLLGTVGLIGLVVWRKGR